MNVFAVDVGNTSVKFGEYRESAKAERIPEPTFTGSLPRDAAPEELAKRLCDEPRWWVVASVHRDAERRLAEWVARSRPGDRYWVLRFTDLPIRLDVEYPERVGIDRLVAAVAVNQLRAGDRPAIVVDAGSAITVDLISESGVFLGGSILPGIAMSASNLAGNTDALPLVRFSISDSAPPTLGKNTEAAIRSGLFWGTVGAIRELIAQLSTGLETPPQVFVTGGSVESTAAPFLDGARVVPNLVLNGIALAARGLTGIMHE